MANKKVEAQIQSKIKRNLKLFVPEVFHIDRLNSGSIDMGRYRIKLCEAGTPDLYALLRCNGGVLLFIEVKKPHGKLSSTQVAFKSMCGGFTNIHHCVAHSTKEVIEYINKFILTD